MSELTPDQRAAEMMLSKFYEHWRELMRKDVVSGLSGIERCTIEIAFKWVCKNFEVREK